MFSQNCTQKNFKWRLTVFLSEVDWLYMHWWMIKLFLFFSVDACNSLHATHNIVYINLLNAKISRLIFLSTSLTFFLTFSIRMWQQWTGVCRYLFTKIVFNTEHTDDVTYTRNDWTIETTLQNHLNTSHIFIYFNSSPVLMRYWCFTTNYDHYKRIKNSPNAAQWSFCVIKALSLLIRCDYEKNQLVLNTHQKYVKKCPMI